MTNEIEVVDGRRVVVCAVALKPAARERLAAMIGDVVFVDIRDAVDTADVVLTPACSPQTVTALKDAYPTARIIVVELEDWDEGIEFGGPVTRLRKAGADAYVTADSLEDLADQLTGRRQGESDAEVLAAVEPRELSEISIDELILTRLAELMEQRQQAVRRSTHD